MLIIAKGFALRAIRNAFTRRVRRAFPSLLFVFSSLLLAALLPAVSSAQVQFIKRQGLAGTPSIPDGVALDASGNLYTANVGSGNIVKLDQFGNQTSVGGGAGMWDDAVDLAGNLYFTNFGSNCVTKAPIGGGSSTCLGTGLSGPTGIAVDAAGNLYIADSGNAQVVEISAGGLQSTLATGLAGVSNVAVDKLGNVFAAASSATSITKIPAGGGSTTTVGAGLTGPQGVAVDLDGNVFVSQSNGTVAEITPSGTQSTLPITGLSNPLNLAVDSSGNLYIPDRAAGIVVVFNAHQATLGYAEVCTGGQPTPCSQTATLNFSFGSDTFASAAYVTAGVAGLDFSQSSTTCTLTSTSCSIVVKFTPQAPGTRTGALFVTDSAGNNLTVPLSGGGFGAAMVFDPFVASAPFGATTFNDPGGLAVDGNGILNGNIFVADNLACQIFKVDSNHNITVFAGTGTCGFFGDGAAAAGAQLNGPFGVVMDGAGNVYIADRLNHAIRKVDLKGNISTVAGQGGMPGGFSGDGGPATSAHLNAPFSVALDAPGNLYIADYLNNRIRKVDLAGIITTIAGSSLTPGFGGDGGLATAAQLNKPQGVRLDAVGNVFIADTFNNVIRKVDLAGKISTVAGNFALGAGYTGDNGPATSAQLDFPTQVSADAAAELFISDGNNAAIRRVDASGKISTLSATPSSFPPDAIVDASGNLAVLDENTSTLLKISRTQAAALAFGMQTDLTTSAAQDETITNIGNQPLLFSAIISDSGFNTNGPNTSCSISSPLAAGLDCILGIQFAPTTTGPYNSAVHLTDNSLGAAAASMQTIPVSGTGVIIPTSTALAAAPNPVSIGQSVTLTASISPAPTGSPLGTVTFFNGSTALGTATPNSSGIATLSITTLPLGSSSLTAMYSGNVDYATSTSSAVAMSVTAPTTTTLTGAPNPSTFGQSVTLTATVTSTTTGTVITGSVTFKNGATTLGTGALNASGIATLTTSTLPVGSLSLTAIYGGDANFVTSTSTVLSFMVNKIATATVLAAAPSPVVAGQSVTLTATITPAPAGAPLGNVTFFNGATSVGTAAPNASGVATLITATLPAGALTLTATYAGNADYLASTSAAITLDVLTSTATSLTAALNPATFEQSVTLTATITPAPTGASLGMVTFFNGGASIGTGAPNASGVATFSASTLPVGTLSLTASYSGNTLFTASTSAPFSLTVNPAPTTTVLTVAPSPATFGQTVLLTATVTPVPTGASLGMVTFFNGATSLGSVALTASGTATLSITTLPAGVLSLTASYSGNADFVASTSAAVPLTVNTTYAVTVATTPFIVAQGGLLTIPVSVPPLGGAYNNIITMSVSGLPKASTGLFVPATVTPGAVTAMTTLSIQLAPLAAGNSPAHPLSRGTPTPLYAAVASLLFFVRRKHLKKSFRAAVFLLFTAFLGAALAGCSGGFLRPPSTPPGTYTVTITGTSGTTVQSARVTVVVQ
jgi:sugar lactone lactonase YvrE